MPTYTYKAKKGPEEIIEGRIEAVTQDDAVEQLNRIGLTPVSVAELNRAEKKQRFARVETGRITVSDIDMFTRQLSSLIKAGIPVLKSLTLISQQVENGSLARVVTDMERGIKDGKMLSEALAQYPRLFNSLYINMVKAGEKSGTLDEVLQNLTDYRQKEEDIRQKIQAALAYPLLILVVGIGTVIIMLTFFLPKLTGLFRDMNQALPFSTRLLIGISAFMSENWHWLILFFIFAIAVFTRGKLGSRKKIIFDAVKLHLPVINKFVMDAEIARFARTLALLLKNGIPVFEGLELATEVLDNEVLKSNLKTARNELITQGTQLSGSLRGIKVFPLFAVNMIAVGEEGGKLPHSLNTIADSYDRQTDQAIKLMTSLLEPLLILVIGSIVGFIVFAMLLPVFNMGISVR